MTGAPAGLARWSESARILGLACVPRLGRVPVLYRALAPHNLLTRTTCYVNLGYWKHDPPDLDRAGAALADLVADAAEMSARDEVLDAGFGFADQDLHWVRSGRAARIFGINLSPEQVAAARERVAEAGLAERIQLEEGDAIRLPVADASFDVVVAVECAFHFQTREAFFREALRVLRPGGRLAIADLCGVEGRPSASERVAARIGRSFWQIPQENLYPCAGYRARLASAGFARVHVESIFSDVQPRFAAWARGRLAEPEVARRMNPVYRLLLRNSLGAGQRLKPAIMDYVIASARKPAG